jgi:hypothetical protein
MMRLFARAMRHGLTVALTAVVCLAQFPGVGSQASSATAAKVISLTGQVSVLRDSAPWALNIGDPVHQRQVIVSGPDGFAIFQVPDGSTFEVFPNSRVVFRNNPASLTDLLDLWMGRVKVHIQKLGGQPNPNRIHTATAVISVRGTIFDVAVEDGDTTWVAVEEGSVGVRHRLIPHDNDRVLIAGDELRVYKNVPLARARVDKGKLAQRGMNALAEAFYTIVLRGGPAAGGGGTGGTGVPGGAGGGGTPVPGDTEGTPPPPPPPPPPGDGGSTPPPPPPGG